MLAARINFRVSEHEVDLQNSKPEGSIIVGEKNERRLSHITVAAVLRAVCLYRGLGYATLFVYVFVLNRRWGVHYICLNSGAI